MRRRLSLFLILALGVILTGCSPQIAFSVKTLPSGRTVKVASVVTLHFSASDPALMLKYYSDVDFSNRALLQAEADDIWQQFRGDVERANFKAAILSANEMPHGMISHTQGFNFVYERKGDGVWTLVGNDKKSAIQSRDPTLSSVTPPAGQESRHP
jgi:hypothetical protein